MPGRCRFVVEVLARPRFTICAPRYPVVWCHKLLSRSQFQ
jgi:hypothetical protein